MNNLPDVIGTLIPIVAIVAVFSFVGVAVWVGERRKEREAFYRTELLRKIAESPGGAAQGVLEMMRQEGREAQIRRREGMKLGGLIVMAAGLGTTALFAMLERGEPAWIIGLVPFLIGVALLGYVLFLAPRIE